MTIQEVKQLDKDSYQIIDIRDENEIAHGAIPGAVAMKAEEIAESPLLDKNKKLVICCSRGKYSVDVAEELSEKGIDAESLEGYQIKGTAEYLTSGELVSTFKASVEKMFNGAATAKGALLITPEKVIVTTPGADNKKVL